jgi:hypothetical protein
LIDCNGDFDDDLEHLYVDTDEHGLGSVFSFHICSYPCYVTNFDDCNDADATLTYYSVEDDNVDNDCDGTIDNGFDLDNDGFMSKAIVTIIIWRSIETF